jgi:hypothetical protein
VREHGVLRWVLAVVAALAIIALLAKARGEPGDDGRWPDRDDLIDSALVVDAGADGA